MVDTPKSQTIPRKNNNVYQKYIVTYIDVMGFKDLIEKKYCGDPKPIKKILRAFQETNQVCSYRVCKSVIQNRVQINYFSDCIVRSVYIDGLEDIDLLYTLDFEIFQMALIQMELIKEGVFIRGAINQGALYTQKDRFFGPAFHEAYKYESQMTVYPVITLCHSLQQYLSDKANHLYMHEILSLINSPIAFDCFNHGLIYINYLFLLSQNRIYKEKQREDFIKAHKGRISKALRAYSNDPCVSMKYQWLKQYHNHYVPKMGFENPDKYIIQ